MTGGDASTASAPSPGSVDALRALVVGAATLGAALAAGGCSAAPVDEASPEPSGIVVELRIGVLEGDDPYMLGDIRAMAAGRDGAIFAYDRQAQAIRMYDATGRYVRDVGRQGQAPGEHELVVELQVLPDGTVTVHDPRRRRILLFDQAGDFVDELAISEGNWGGMTGPMFDADGLIYTAGVLDMAVPEGQWQGVLRGYDREGNRVREIELPRRSSTDLRNVAGFVVQTPEGVIDPFTATSAFAWSPLGYLVVGNDNREYRIEIRDPAGSRVLERDVPRVPLRGVERDEWETMARFAQQRSMGSRDALEYPEDKPVFRAIRVGDEGRIWVRRYVEAERYTLPPFSDRPPLNWSEPPTFDVFEPSGDFAGTIVLPRGIQLHVIRGSTAWGVETDADGVVRIVRLRLPV